MTYHSTELRSNLERAAPSLWKQLGTLAKQWAEPAIARLDDPKRGGGYPKTFNDPVWGVVELLPWETVVLDSPLVQRLRGIRQLGMAHLVYPGAGHDRLEHSRGVVEAADRMIRALERNAAHRRRFGQDRDQQVPKVSDRDRYSIRLAALLHDIGHGPFSHATEQLIGERHQEEFQQATTLLRAAFDGATSIAIGEVVAAIIVLSPAMTQLLTHPRIGRDTESGEFPEAITARLLGSREHLDAKYLSGIISGPIDADKLDYIARDCHHSGLPLGIDLTRLISKLEVVVVTPENAPNQELRERSRASKHGRIYDMGISQAGLGSYEQLVIARVLLHDRLYYHHKVRAAEAMLRELIVLAEKERKDRYSIQDLFSETTDDIFVGILGGELRSSRLSGGGLRSASIAKAIGQRRIHYRAYAFSARFISAPKSLTEEDLRDTRALMWRRLLRQLSSDQRRREVANHIYKKSLILGREISELAPLADGLQPEEILVDLPFNKVVVRGGDILTRTDQGHVGTPNLFFDPERWSQAYEHQKQCGFVYASRSRVPLVSLAARLVFFDTYGLVMDEQADRAAKVTGLVQDDWLTCARDSKLCSPECADALQSNGSPLVRFRADDFNFPATWSSEDHQAASRIATELNTELRSGLPASFHKAVCSTMDELAFFLDMAERNGRWVSASGLGESQLQATLREFLDARQTEVKEGAEYGGGETDLVLFERIVVENKVLKGGVSDPFAVGEDRFGWQARRYSLSLCSRVVFVVAAYKPATEGDLFPLTDRIRVRSLGGPSEQRCEVRIVLPWGMDVPSTAKQSRTPDTEN